MGHPLAKRSADFTRRSFMQTLGGVVALSVVSIPTRPETKTFIPSTPDWAPRPGTARQRYEGVSKVTGEKIFARDFNARNLVHKGWPAHQWYGMYLRALTTRRRFLNVNLSGLDPTIKPVKVVLGSDFATGILSPQTASGRDLIVDEEIAAYHAERTREAIATGGQIDHPHAVEFDLVVQPGNRPDFLGQAVALLLFDDRAKYRAAKAQLQFQDDLYQIYGPDIGPSPDAPQNFSPETLYVKEDDPSDPTKNFSYYSADRDDYENAAQDHIKSIQRYLNTTPDLIQHRFDCEMRAMDPMFMEPESGLIWYDRETRKMSVLLGTQSPDGDVSVICDMYGNCGEAAAVDEVELISCYPGGGFGGRDSSPFSMMLALCADFAEGNPVKLEYDRFEQFRVGLKRHACELTGRLAVTRDQNMQVVEMNMSFDGGGRRNLSPYVAQLAALCAGGSYKLPMANVFGKAIHSENISGGSQRGFGGPQAFFAIETAVDEICQDQRWDPIDFRRRNLVREGDTTVIGGPIKQELRLDEMLGIAAAHPLWRDRSEIQAGHAQRGKLYGTGLAMSLQAYGTSGDGVVAAITLAADGTWKVQSDAVDMGNGSATTLGVVIGPVLGANASDVEMGGYTLFGQTTLKKDQGIGCYASDDAPMRTWQDWQYTKKGVGSSSACLTGLHQVHVVQQCAHAVMAVTILPAARALWGVSDLDETQVYWRDRALHFDGGYDAIPLEVLGEFVNDPGNQIATGAVSHAYFQETWVSANYETPVGLRRFALDGLATYRADVETPVPIERTATEAMACETGRASRFVWAPCLNVVGLTVDRRSGAVEIQNVLSVLNAGRVHVPELVSGQSQGGVAMALGWALHEDIPPGMAGPADGTWNLNRYHVPRYIDVPLATEFVPGGRSQELVILDESAGDQKQGRGIAEAVMCSIAPAVSNALKDATGIRFTSLPMTAEKIKEGLRA